MHWRCQHENHIFILLLLLFLSFCFFFRHAGLNLDFQPLSAYRRLRRRRRLQKNAPAQKCSLLFHNSKCLLCNFNQRSDYISAGLSPTAAVRERPGSNANERMVFFDRAKKPTQSKIQGLHEYAFQSRRSQTDRNCGS